MINAICIFLLVLPIRYSIERIKPFSNKERTLPWISEMQKIDQYDSSNRKVIFNCKYPIQTMFFTDFVAYERIPTVEKLKKLDEEGVAIYIDNYNAEEFSGLDFINYTYVIESSR